jgi:ParB family chromosome partitioning protein
MKAAESLRARLGANINQSVGPVAAGTSLSAPAPTHGDAAKNKGVSRLRDALVIALDQLQPDPDQPRKDFDQDDLARLAESLRSRGQLQPIRVRWSPQASRWVVIDGERRYRAAIKAGLETLVCIDAAKPQTADEILEDQLVANCVRADLLPIEQAVAFKTLMDRRGWSTRQLGEVLHLSNGQITRVINLLNLPDAVQERVASGDLPAATAYELTRVEDAGAQVELAERAVAEGLTRAEVRERVQRAAPKSKGRGAKPGSKTKAKARPFDLKHRGPTGIKIVASAGAKHSHSDVIAELRAFADRLEAELKAHDDQQAA